MTSTIPAHRVPPPMTHTPDPATTSQAQIVDDAVADRPARPRLRDQIAENPLLSLAVGLVLALFTLLGTVVVALLVFALNSFDDRFDRLEARMDRLEAKVDAGFAAQGAQIAELERKLTALIANLNATAAVDAALEHRLVIPGAGTVEPEGEPPD